MHSNKYTIQMAIATLLLLVMAMPVSASGDKQPEKISLSSYKKKASLKAWPQRKSLTDKKSMLSRMAGGRLAPVMKAPVTAVQAFEGALLYSDTWEEYYHPYGVATFTSENPTTMKQVFENDEMPQTGGGFFTDKYYFMTAYSEDWWSGELTAYTLVYDKTSWEEVFEVTQDITALATDLSYDAIDDVAYGCFYAESGEGVDWGYMDVHSLSVTHIAPLQGQLIAVAVNSRGEAYAVTNSGYFVKGDKKTGALTPIGHTGLTPAYLQSATFGGDGRFYWAASLSDDTSALYTIDLTTGSASLVTPFPGNEEVVALGAIAATPADEAPTAPKGLAAAFANDQLSGVVSFSIPAKTFGGSTLSGDIAYTVTVDGEDLATGTAAAGQAVSVPITVGHAGYHYFVVTLSNEAGESTPATLRQWVGIDEPQPVTNVVLTKTGEREATVTWTAPTASVHGGYFSTDRLTYNVTRLPDGKQVATGLKTNTYIDNVDITGQALVRYSVTVLADDVEGASATSNGIIYGDAFEVPVHFSFDTEDEFNIFTVIDNNETPSLDSGSWLYSPSGQVAGYNTGTKDGDDWLITPAISMKADRQYTFQYDVCCYSDYWPDEYSVFMGNAATAEAMTTQLLPRTTIYWDEFRTMTFTVTVPEDGVYYFGFYATSEAGGAFFLIDDIKVEEGLALKAPAEVTDLTVVAGENGALTATVSFIAPEKSVDGKMLTAISSIDVKRGGNVVKTFSSPEPGERLTFTEENVPEGMATYEITASASDGLPIGATATAEAWVGIDYPSAPLNVTVALNADGHPVITWQQPNGRGVYGGYVDNANVTYTVYKTTTGRWLKQGITASGSADGGSPAVISYTDESVTTDNNGDQSLLEYAVFAESPKGLGYPATAFCIDGAPYALPFAESFADTKPAHFWGFYGTNGESWKIGDDWSYYSQDEDDGLLAYLPAVAGSEVTAFSGKIAMGGAKNPVLTFYLCKMSYENNGFYETNPDDDELYVQVAADGFDLQTVHTIRMKDITKSGYQLYQVPLTQFADNDFIVIAFTQHAASDQTPIMLDNIKIESLLTTNLTLASVTAPESLDFSGSPASDKSASDGLPIGTITATVKNTGLTAVDDYTLELYRGDLLEQSKSGLTLATGQTAIETFEVQAQPSWGTTETFTVRIVCEADEDPTDNVSDPFTIAVIRPDMPAPTDLAVTVSASVSASDGLPIGTTATFTWNAPAGLEAQSETVTDGFESYKHGDRTYGDWTCIDKALFGEYGIITIKDADGDDISFPHYDEWQAFMVFSPASAFIDIESNPQWAPHSGKRMLISICDYANAGWGTTYRNNDWLISPKLDGTAQTITFWARTASTTERKDYLEVRYTTTAPESASDGFPVGSLSLLTGGTIQLNTEWTRYEFTLPEGTLYFALRNNTDGGTGVLIDDITYTRGIDAADLTLLGYNLYCNGQQVNSSLITETTYTLTNPADGTYTVKAYYDGIGESEASNAVTISDMDGISTVNREPFTVNQYYDLQGRSVQHPLDGHIYLVGGRKVLYRK